MEGPVDFEEYHGAARGAWRSLARTNERASLAVCRRATADPDILARMMMYACGIGLDCVEYLSWCAFGSPRVNQTTTSSRSRQPSRPSDHSTRSPSSSPSSSWQLWLTGLEECSIESEPARSIAATVRRAASTPSERADRRATARGASSAALSSPLHVLRMSGVECRARRCVGSSSRLSGIVRHFDLVSSLSSAPSTHRAHGASSDESQHAVAGLVDSATPSLMLPRSISELGPAMALSTDDEEQRSGPLVAVESEWAASFAGGIAASVRLHSSAYPMVHRCWLLTRASDE